MKHFAFYSDIENSRTPPILAIESLLTTQAASLRTLIIDNCWGRYPDASLSIRNLRKLFLSLDIPPHRLAQLLESGQQLESLGLEVLPGRSPLSWEFRLHSKPGSFPLLREFSFMLLSSEDDFEKDPDLFPAVAEVVRGHPMLEALSLSNRNAQNPADFGYSAAIWGVLPSLVHLRSLSMDVPEGVPSALCGWLIPRTVVALNLQVDKHLRVKVKIDCNVSTFPYRMTS